MHGSCFMNNTKRRWKKKKKGQKRTRRDVLINIQTNTKCVKYVCVLKKFEKKKR